MAAEDDEVVGWRAGVRQGARQVARIASDPRKVRVIGSGVEGNEHGRGVQRGREERLSRRGRGGPSRFEDRDERVGLARLVGAAGGPCRAGFGERGVEERRALIELRQPLLGRRPVGDERARVSEVRDGGRVVAGCQIGLRP